MSCMQAMHIKLTKCDECLEQSVEEKISTMDEYEASDYLSDQSLLFVNERLWKYVLKDKLDPEGFTKVLNLTDNSCELVTLFYNGGCHENGIVEEVLKGTCQ